jgi:hypothetical protein
MTSSWPILSVGILGLIVLLGIFVIWKLIKNKRSGFPLKDERTQRITGLAATYAFYVGSYFMIALMLANLLNLEFLGEPLLDTGYALVASILVQSLTFIGLRLYFDRKGDF